MKKHYKPKIKNINKLKTYLQDAIKGDNKRSGGSARSKQCDPKCNNLH